MKTHRLKILTGLVVQLPEGACPHNIYDWLVGDHNTAMRTFIESLYARVSEEPGCPEQRLFEAIQIMRVWAEKMDTDTHTREQQLVDANRRIETLEAMLSVDSGGKLVGD